VTGHQEYVDYEEYPPKKGGLMTTERADALQLFHDRKKDGTPTDTPHPHKKSTVGQTVIRGAKTTGTTLGIAAVVIGAGVLKRAIKRRRGFSDMADALHLHAIRSILPSHSSKP